MSASLPSTASHITTSAHRSVIIPTEPDKWRALVWVRTFVVFQFACQLALLFEYFNPLRVYVRAAAFGSSLLLLIILPKGRTESHPAVYAAGWALAVLCLSMFHPTTSSFLAGAGQIALYLAIMAPLFWVPRLKLSSDGLRKVLLVIFIFYNLSAATGVLQAYFPGQFEPALSSSVANMDKGYVEDLKITLANGQRVFRPMGLTDVPGGAGTAGFYTVLLGLGFYLTSRRRAIHLICFFSITMGLFCLYLSQIRSWLVITSVSLLALCGLLLWQGRMSNFRSMVSMLIVVIALSFTLAVSIGGQGITNRMSTLIMERPDVVYYRNRGFFLEYTIYELLPEYPFGAGLGRWGYMNGYFGDNNDPNRAGLYVEIQWTGWLLDGGLPLILAYVIMLFIAMRKTLQIALSRTLGELSIWGGIMVAYNLGVLAVTFNYPVFIGQGGMEFWLLNATLFAAARSVLPQAVSLRRLPR